MTLIKSSVVLTECCLW